MTKAEIRTSIPWKFLGIEESELTEEQVKLFEEMNKRVNGAISGNKETMDISTVFRYKLLEVKRENFYKAYDAYMDEHDVTFNMMILRFITPEPEEETKDLEKLYRCWDEVLLRALTVKEEDFIEASKRTYDFMREKRKERVREYTSRRNSSGIGEVESEVGKTMEISQILKTGLLRIMREDFEKANTTYWKECEEACKRIIGGHDFPNPAK